jgi:hypothetical protein
LAAITAIIRSGSENTNILILSELFAASIASTMGFFVSSGKMMIVLVEEYVDILLIVLSTS